MTDTRMRLRRGLLVSLLAMSLTACAALPGGPAPSDRVDAAQRRAHATADALDAWVARIAMLPLGTSMRQQVHGAEPDGRLIEYLAAILNEIPPREELA